LPSDKEKEMLRRDLGHGRWKRKSWSTSAFSQDEGENVILRVGNLNFSAFRDIIPPIQPHYSDSIDFDLPITLGSEPGERRCQYELRRIPEPKIRGINSQESVLIKPNPGSAKI
jgi:hypothetical protein